MRCQAPGKGSGEAIAGIVTSNISLGYVGLIYCLEPCAIDRTFVQ